MTVFFGNAVETGAVFIDVDDSRQSGFGKRPQRVVDR
jgi:hypothetical protein